MKRPAMPKHLRPTMLCPGCHGSGRVQMSDELYSVLRAVRLIGPASAVEVWSHLGGRFGAGVWATAINNRLETLRREGCLTRKREGKTWRYWEAGR